MASSWTDLLRALGEAFSAVLSSEAQALRQDFAASRRKLVGTLVVAGLAFFVLFWAVGAAGISILEALSLVLPRWLSALIVLIVLLCVGGVLGMLAKRRFASIESPVDTVERRIANHVDWWQQSILDQESDYSVSELNEGDSDEEMGLEASDE